MSSSTALHQEQTPSRGRRRERSSGQSATTSNSMHTAKSFGDCQTPNSGRSPPATVLSQGRRSSKAYEEDSLKNAIISFDAQIFSAIWKQLKSDDTQPELFDAGGVELSPNEFGRDTQWTGEVDVSKLTPSVEFSRRDCLLVAIDGKSIGANRQFLSDSSRLLHLEFLVDGGDALVKLPFRFDALVPVVAAIYHYQHHKDDTLTRRMFADIDLTLMFEVFHVAVRLNVPFLIEIVGSELFHRSTPSTYIITYHQLKIFCTRFGEQLWLKIVAEFYKLQHLRSHKLLNASEIRRVLFHERINIARGDEVALLRTWARSNRLECQPAEYQALRRQLTDQLIGSLGTRGRRVRLPYSVLFALGGWGAHGPTERLEILNGYTENWIEPRAAFGELTSPRCYYSAIPMPEDQHVYVLGGFNGQHYYEGSTRFSLETLSWDESSYAPLHERRCYVNASRLDATHILACGGYNNTSRMTTAEILDIRRNAWTQIPPMNIVRSDAHAVELDGRVYVIGGFDGHACHRSVEFYDPHHNSWTMMQAEMRDKRSGVSALAINGALFAVGGFTGRHRLNTVEFWDPREGHWNRVSPMILNRSNFGISELRSNPICVGGYDGHGTTEMCERFDWRADKWENMPSLRFRRSALSLFRVDNLPNVERLFGN